MNQLRALLVSAPQDIRDRLWKSKPHECVTACMSFESSEKSPLLLALCCTLRSLATLGGVIQPGTEIMEVTPLDDQLLVETKIKPSDVTFIAPGQKAIIKISAYDYAIYGGLNFRVENISPGALKDEEAKMPKKSGTDETIYRVIVRTESNTLTKKGSRELRVIPGITASVDIRTGEKSRLQYMQRPLLRVQEAFREK